MRAKKKRGGKLPPSFWKWAVKALVAGAFWLAKKLFFNNRSNSK